MAYEKTNWQNGDVITAEKLNHAEQGIANACLTLYWGEYDGADALFYDEGCTDLFIALGTAFDTIEEATAEVERVKAVFDAAAVVKMSQLGGGMDVTQTVVTTYAQIDATRAVFGVIVVTAEGEEPALGDVGLVVYVD